MTTSQPTPETIQLPEWIVNLTLSRECVILLSQCIDAAPLSKQVRQRIEGEFTNAIKNAVKPPERNGVEPGVSRVSDFQKVD